MSYREDTARKTQRYLQTLFAVISQH